MPSPSPSSYPADLAVIDPIEVRSVKIPKSVLAVYKVIAASRLRSSAFVMREDLMQKAKEYLLDDEVRRRVEAASGSNGGGGGSNGAGGKAGSAGKAGAAAVGKRKKRKKAGG